MQYTTSINRITVTALAALVAVVGTISSALAYETGYGRVQLVTAQQIADPPGPCNSADTEPSLTSAVAPHYPEIALEEGLEGFSIVTFTMGLEGNVSDVKLAGTSGNRLFDKAAVDAVKSSHFAPAMQHCAKISGTYGVPVVFSQKNAPDWPGLVLGVGAMGGGRQYIK